jgi:hypothetical protein
MIQFIGHELIWVIRILNEQIEKAGLLIAENGPGCNATSGYRRHLTDFLDKKVLGLCMKLKLTESHGRCMSLSNRALEQTQVPRLTYDEIKIELTGLTLSITSEMNGIQFAYIPEDKSKFFDKNDLFGDAVSGALPEAAFDIKEAGNCIAADLNTAAIFHLMRVSEYGMRALAKLVQVPIADRDLEYKEWNPIIEQIEAALREKGKNPPGTAKDKAEDREFYSGLATDLRAFKDVFRNNVMHTRGNYNAKEAEGVYDRVHDFMTRLATRVPLS